MKKIIKKLFIYPFENSSFFALKQELDDFYKMDWIDYLEKRLKDEIPEDEGNLEDTQF